MPSRRGFRGPRTPARTAFSFLLLLPTPPTPLLVLHSFAQHKILCSLVETGPPGNPLAAFNVHISAGLAVSGTAATSIMVVGLATAQEMLLYFVLGTVGSLLPDVDSKSSAPVHITFALLSTLMAFAVMFFVAGSYPTVAELMLVWLGTYLAFRWLVFFLFNRLTDHRGLFHSLPAALLSAAITATLTRQVLDFPAFQAWMSGCFLGTGYLLHLLLDELHSLHLFGMRQRRSLGTALKLYRKGYPVATLSLYLALAGLLWWVPDPQQFVRTVANPLLHTEIQNRFLPAEGWFKL